MYEGSFLQTRWTKTLNVSVDQKTRPSICLKICDQCMSLWKAQSSFWNTRPSFQYNWSIFWEFKRKVKAQPRVWKARLCACIIRRPMLSQSATVKYDECVLNLVETHRRSAWNRKGRTQRVWRNFTTFFTELKKQDGHDFEPNASCSPQASLDSYLRERGYMDSILKSREFTSSKAVLVGKARVIREYRKGSKK